MGLKKNAYKLLVRKHETKKADSRAGYRWGQNINLELNEQAKRRAVNPSDLQQEPAGGSSEHQNKPPFLKMHRNDYRSCL